MSKIEMASFLWDTAYMITVITNYI